MRILATGPGTGLQACGRFLAPEGRYYPGLHVPVPPEQLVSAALAEVHDGAAWIKVIADFPFLGPGEQSPAPWPTYPLDDIRRLVEAVHDAGARVAAHSTTGYVTELIAAGIDSVEHGTALDEAGIESLAARGGAWTPTLCATTGPRDGDTPARQKARLELRERLRYLLPKAAGCGLTIMTGTDVVGSIPREVALLAELGLPPHAALAAASTSARQFLGFTSLHEGEPADLVTYGSDPRDDPAVLSQPTAIFAGRLTRPRSVAGSSQGRCRARAVDSDGRPAQSTAGRPVAEARSAAASTPGPAPPPPRLPAQALPPVTPNLRHRPDWHRPWRRGGSWW